MRRLIERAIAGLCLLTLCSASVSFAHDLPLCKKPVHLMFDTGHMGVALFVAQILTRQDVRATFFLANERTQDGGSSLDETWAPWWKALLGEGNAFGSHTYDHVYWLADLPNGGFRAKSSAGPQAGKRLEWSAAQYCDELKSSAQRFTEMTGQTMLPIFRAPGGKTSASLLRAAHQCGFRHVGWSEAGFLGGELPRKPIRMPCSCSARSTRSSPATS